MYTYTRLTTEQQANQCQQSHLMELWLNKQVIWDTMGSTLQECWPTENMCKQQQWSIKLAHNPLHKAMKTQGDANWDRASFGWVKQRTQYCKYASWQNSSKPRSGKPIPASLWDTPARKLGKALRRMDSRQNSQRSSFSFKKTANHKTS